MMSKGMKRLLTDAGASLSETLVTVLLLSIVLAAMVAGIPAVMSAYRNVRLKADAQTLLATAVSAVTEEARWAEDVTFDNGTYEFYSSRQNARVKLVNGSYGTSEAGLSASGIFIFIKTADGTSSRQLLTQKTQTLGLYASIQPIKSDNQCVNYTISVFSSEDSTAPLESTDLSVRPIADYQE
jgi:Tfp pilus assembly protein PilV